MGCDIHAYVEYASKDGDRPYWMTLVNRSNLSRNYALFAKLAGVRADDNSEQMIPRRGLPEDAALMTRWDNQLYVCDDSQGAEYASKANAERWVREGSSEWTDDRCVSITHPYWHSHSWCSVAEFRKVLEADYVWAVQASYWAILAALEELERRNNQARLVFWFDN